jgi:hypothetical protein
MKHHAAAGFGRGDGRSRAMAEAGRWPKQGDGRSGAMARPFIHVPLFSVPGCHPGLKHSQDVQVVIAVCVSRACVRPSRASAVPSTVACGVRTSMWPVVAVMHADNGAGPSVDVPCGLCTGREARRRGRCTGMLRQWQRQQGQRGQRRQQRQLCRSPARALVPELRMKIQQ